MGRSLATVVLAASACAATAPRPIAVESRSRGDAGPVAPIVVEITRASGNFEREVMRRHLHRHATACRRDRAGGAVTLELALVDRPDRRGLRVVSATGDRRLRACLGPALIAATWPTGRLDGYALFTVVVHVP